MFLFYYSAASLSNPSGTTSTRSHTVTQSNQPQDLQEPGEDDRPEIEACDGEVEPSQVRFVWENDDYTCVQKICCTFKPS